MIFMILMVFMFFIVFFMCFYAEYMGDLSVLGTATLPLLGPSEQEIGRVSIACEVLRVQQDDLANSLALAHVERQTNAYLISGSAPIVQGLLVDETSDSSEGSPPTTPTAPLAGQRVFLHAGR